MAAPARESDRRATLQAIFRAGIAAVQPKTCVPPFLPGERPQGRNVVLALGKAAGQMAKVAVDRLHIDEALIITRHGHMPPGWTPPAQVRVIEAGHPNPDAASLLAGEAAKSLATSLGKGDRLLALISGGGSALMVAPARGISFADKQSVNRAMLASGAPIAAMNRVRAAMSLVKGGRLADLAFPAEIITCVISDVPGDDPAFVASGPTCAMTEGESALEIVTIYGIAISAEIARALASHRPSSGAFGRTMVVAKAADALRAMAESAAAAGYDPVILGDHLEGEAGHMAREHARLAIECLANNHRAAIISGGESSVALVPGGGKGGRNLTFALTLALELDGAEGISALAADSDGIDGTSEAAGTMVVPSTLARAKASGMDPRKSLSDQDSSEFFARLGDAVVTGPTGTNVNDLRVILVDPVRA